jgi:hypothetical protein
MFSDRQFEGWQIMNEANQYESATRSGTPVSDLQRLNASLKPKGSCWYCNHPVDNVRRFCNKTCAQDYLLEEEVFRKPA